MDFGLARETVLNLLRTDGRTRNSQALDAIGGDHSLLDQIREDLIFHSLADDIEGVGLRYIRPDTDKNRTASLQRPRIFLSYGRRDAKELADRLAGDLTSRGYQVWQDTSKVLAGSQWQHEIADGLRSAQLLVALLTPHSVRTTQDAESPDHVDSVCLSEISYALFNPPPQPVVPVMVETCEPPLAIFHLDFVDLRAWSESDDRYSEGLQRLIDGIQATLRGERRYRSWYHQLDPWDFSAFLYTKRRNFCGRRWLFDKIEAFLTCHREPALLIKGDPGSGKSAIVAELIHRNPNSRVLAYHCCQWDTAETLQPWRFVRSSAAMIASKLDAYAAMMETPGVKDTLSEMNCRSDPGSALERGVLAPLQRLHAPEGGTRCLLIDALDESLLLQGGSPTIVDLLASRLDRLPPWLRIVATTRRDGTTLERLRGLLAEELDAQLSENLEDIALYIEHRLSSPELARQLAETQCTPQEVSEALREKSQGNFLFVQQALDSIERGEHRPDQLDTLPAKLGGLYFLRFNEQFPDRASFADAREILNVIVAAREPLSEQEIARATDLDADAQLPAALEQLSAYLPARIGADNVLRFAVYHKSLVDWLTAPDRRGKLLSASVKDGHHRLAEACWDEYRNGKGSMSRYTQDHMAAHLAAASRWEDLHAAIRGVYGALDLLGRWIDRGHSQEGLTCLIGLVDYLRHKQRDRKSAAELATQVARLHTLGGAFEKAEQWLKDALQWAPFLGGRRSRAIAYHELGSLQLYQWNDLPQAKHFYRCALRQCKYGLPQFHDEASANLVALATTLVAEHSYRHAISLAHRALNAARRANDTRHLIAARQILSVAYKDIGSYEEAISHLDSAVRVAEVANLPVHYAEIELIRGWLLYERAVLDAQPFSDAVKSFEAVQRQATLLGHVATQIEALLGLGCCRLAETETEAAEGHMSEAGEIGVFALPRDLEAWLKLGLAAVRHQKCDMHGAAQDYQEVIEFCRQHALPRSESDAWVGLGAAYWHRGDADEAESCWQKAQIIARRCSPVRRRLVRLSISEARQNEKATPY